MTQGLRPLPFRKVDRALRALGFQPVRQRGSHVRYRHADGRTITVPNHPGQDVARGTLRAIQRDLDADFETFERLT